MTFCTDCGTPTPDGARFCPGCGKPVVTESAKAATPPSTAPTTPGGMRQPPISAPRPGWSAASLILPVVALIAVLVIGLLLWSQRNGTRPIAGNDSAVEERVAVEDTDTPAAPAPDAEGAGERPDEAAGEVPDRPAQQPADAATATSAAALDSAFFRDPRGAAERYAGPVRVSGVIATMVTPGATPALSLEGRTRFNHMIVNFPVGYRERLAPLAKGQNVTVSCGGARAVAGTTILNDCALD